MNKEKIIDKALEIVNRDIRISTMSYYSTNPNTDTRTCGCAIGTLFHAKCTLENRLLNPSFVVSASMFAKLEPYFGEADLHLIEDAFMGQRKFRVVRYNHDIENRFRVVMKLYQEGNLNVESLIEYYERADHR